MLPASYSVIRYIADPARDEPHNVGVLAWTDLHHRLQIDDEAVMRVVRDNPRLHPDSLLFLEPAISDRLGLEDWRPAAVAEFTAQQKGYPFLLSEPRMTTVSANDSESLADTVQRLVDRVVRPRRRYGRSSELPFDLLERRIQPLLRLQAVSQNHFFAQTRTGVPRRVDFFANHGANLAVETLKLDLKRGQDIILRADAQANKVADIRSVNDVTVVVFATFSEAEDTREVNLHARQILETSTARLVDSLDDVVDELATAAGRDLSAPL